MEASNEHWRHPNEHWRKRGLTMNRLLRKPKKRQCVFWKSSKHTTTNLAKVLGLTIPPGVFAIADDVIE